MQNTRLTNLVDSVASRLGQWFLNPWRRLSLLLINFFFGFFLGTAISTIAGQRGVLDIVIAGFLVVLTEVTSKVFYGSRFLSQQFLRSASLTLLVESLNVLKVGFIYSMFVESFKLGS